MPREIISVEEDEQLVTRALEKAADRLGELDAENAALMLEIERTYQILSIFEPIVRSYIDMARKLDIDDEQQASLDLVIDAAEALLTGLTVAQSTLERVEELNE